MVEGCLPITWHQPQPEQLDSWPLCLCPVWRGPQEFRWAPVLHKLFLAQVVTTWTTEKEGSLQT